MSFLVEQAFLGRDEIRAPLETPTWEATKQGKQKYALLLHFFLLELILCSFIIHDVFVLFLSADKYTFGIFEYISLEIKPTTHTGLLLSSWRQGNAPDYIVLEMSSGNVSSKLLCCCDVVQCGLVQ